jgi:putative intracellular protease/amidase
VPEHGDKIVVRKQYESGKLVAAICAAPSLPCDFEIFNKYRELAQFSIKNELNDVQMHELKVVDRNIITRCSPARGIKFVIAILEMVSIAPVR